MSILTEEQSKETVALNAEQVLVAIQIVDRAYSVGGFFKGNEVTIVGNFRQMLVETLEKTTGVNYDVKLAELTQAQKK